jgi:hypothetical protein
MKGDSKRQGASVKRILMFLLAAFFLAGCSSGFKYQRKAEPAQDSPKQLPVNIAVVAFEDKTRDFTSEGNIFSGYLFNLARTDINGTWLLAGAAFSVSSLPAAQWSKVLAEEMSVSGAFRTVKFVFSPSEVPDGEIVVEGALTKAYFTTINDKPDEFMLHLKARKTHDNTVAWEGDVGKIAVRPGGLTTTCLGYGGCVVGRIHEYLNGVMQGIFADVRRDLVLALAPPPEKKPDVPGQTSPEEVIKNILGNQ